MKFLVIGGVAAGTKTAAKLKRMNPEADVTVLTKGKDISYAGCGLPYYISGVIESKEQLIVNTPAKFTALTGAKVLTEREAISLLPQNKQVIAKNLRTGMEETYEYDECVIATGASAIVPPIQGVSLPGVFTMRTPQDAIELKEYLRQNEVKTAVVAGGGFIGLEAAENLASLGISVTVIDMAEQIMDLTLNLPIMQSVIWRKRESVFFSKQNWKLLPENGRRRAFWRRVNSLKRMLWSCRWESVQIPHF